MTTATYVLEVDWSGNGTFAETGEDVTANVLAMSCQRGADRASQLTGQAVAGRLQALLLNTDGDYSPLNSGSPIAGNILPGRKVRLRTTSPSAATLWTGFLDRIEPDVVVGPYNTAHLYASGPFIKLSGPNTRVSPTAQQDADTGTIIGAILDATDWPAGDRAIDTDGIELRHWYVESKGALEAIHEVEETEVGFAYEGTAWDIVYETRYHRYLNNLSSQATFSDAVGATNPYQTIQEQDPLREIFNEFVITVQPHQEQSASVLWTLSGETPTIAASASIIYFAQYPNSATGGAQGAYVKTWTTPVVGTDITQTGVGDGDIAVAVSKFANAMKITITNNHVSAQATITLLQARGIPVLKLNPFKIIQSDATSKTAYGTREYPLASPWYPNAAHAEAAAALLLAKYKDQQAFLSIGFTANKSSNLMTQALARDISDRITVVAANNAQLGINQDFYIEAISFDIDQGNTRMRIRYDLSPAESDPAYWILNTDELSAGTKLAY